MNKFFFPLFQIGVISCCSLLGDIPVTAQSISSDGTLTTPTEVNPTATGVEINGGTTRGGNLFHSFKDFSVSTGSEAFFNNAPDVVNILNRVTGGSISSIDGLLRANGSANLFLINPAGIVFGEGARLDIGGSFYGSTADSILFPDGVEFSATDTGAEPILTINAPIGLNFRDNPGEIVNRSNANGFGLSVPEGESISLIGGNVTFDGGIIFAPGGRVELGGLTETGTVNFNNDGSLTFADGIAKGDVSLTDSSIVSVLSDVGGSIGVNATKFELSSGSQFVSGIRAGKGSVDAQAGDIVVNATDSVLIDGQGDSNTGIFANVLTNSIGNAGNIEINTSFFNLSNLALLNASTSGQGNAGNIDINASDSIVIEGQEGTSFNTNILTSALNSLGNAGNINLITSSLTLNNGASLVAFANNQSSAGDITITANDAVSLANQSNINVTTGTDGGFLTIDAKSLEITSQSSLIAGINIDSGSAETQAGDIVINVAEDLLINGFGGNTQAQTNIVNSNFSTGNAGNVIINARNIDFKNGGNIFNFNSGPGNLGSINLTATENITFDGIKGSLRSGVSNFITETGTGDIGNIEITAQNLTLTNGATIQSSVAGMADSGDINIDVTDNIRIDGINNPVLEDGTVTTVSSEIISEGAIGSNSNSGDINITTGSLFISNGGAISSDLFGTGNAGNITVNATDIVSLEGLVEGELPEVGIREFPSNISARVIRNAVGNGGSIEINTGNFSITNLAQLTTTSAGQGNAGNITVNATDSFIANNSLITSNIGDPGQVAAIGEVGSIFIDAKDIVLNNTAQIQAGAFSGATVEQSGIVSLTASESISFTGLNTGIFSNNDPGSFGNANNTQLFASIINLKDGAVIFADNKGQGNGGNITVQADNLNLENSANISAATVSGIGGTVTLDIADNIILRENSFISARAFNNADGGNINIDTDFIVAFPNQNNDVIANAQQGSGGNITINAQSVFGIEERPLNDLTNDINASSEVFGLEGDVTINTPDVDPFQETAETPENIVEPDQVVAGVCDATQTAQDILAGRTNSFVVKGKGGIPPTPVEPIPAENLVINGQSVVPNAQVQGRREVDEKALQEQYPPIMTDQGAIYPARGIVKNPDGTVILTRYPIDNTQRVLNNSSNCGV